MVAAGTDTPDRPSCTSSEMSAWPPCLKTTKSGMMTLERVGAERAWGMQGPRVAEKTGLCLPQSAGTSRALLGDPQEGGRGLAHPGDP